MDESRASLIRAIIAKWKIGRLLEPEPYATCGNIDDYYYEITENDVDGSLMIEIRRQATLLE
jgi:hypothetical protein